jgi:glycine oxidase
MTLQNEERPARVTVIGGGVVGLSAARELAGRGVRVAVVDVRRIGHGASARSVGVLSAPTRAKSAFARLCRQGYESYPELALALREETGVEIGYRECGCVHLLGRPPANVDRRAARWRDAGVGVELLGRDGIESAIPGFGGRFAAALELDREALVEPERLIQALRASCASRGVELREEATLPPIRELEGGERGAVVLAAGCWSGLLALELGGPPLRVEPARGQALEIDHPAPRRIVHFDASFNGKGYFLVPRGEDRVWVGSTVEDAGFDESTTAAGREELLAAAREVLPGLAGEDIVRHWAGLRPKALRRGGPFLCRWPGPGNLWVACGHYRSGILTAPATARLLADAMIKGEPLPEAFALE